MSPSAITNSKTVLLEFENNINHRHLLKTFGNKKVICFITLYLDGVCGITCLQM